MRLPSRPFASVLPLLAASCMVGPDYEPPSLELPASFREADATLTTRPADLTAWWQRLGDPVLDELIARAARQNHDLREAMARVDEARALRGVAAADLWPSLDARASYQRRGESENTQFGAFVQDGDRWATGFDASWEIDLFGRVRRSIEAADADLMRDVETARGVAVTVAAETALAYVQLRSLQGRIVIARQNIDLQQQTLGLARARFEAGLVGEGDVAQAASNLATTQALVPALEILQRNAENRLAVLVGEVPGSLAASLAVSQPIPAPPREIAVGVPADVLRQRPDVRAAERALAAATARIGVAEADLYPQLTLLGTIGLETDDADKVFDSGSTVTGIGPSLRWHLFDGGALRRRVEAQDARARQALIAWERQVLVALEETENAMTAFVREQTRRGLLNQAAAEARRAVEFAQVQYREGLTDFQNVLVSQRALANLEDQLVESDAAVTQDLVALYRALGGGFEPVPQPSTSTASAPGQ